MPQPDPRPKAPGRFRAAWQVLMGERLTPLQVHHEWVEYKSMFDDILTRFGAQLARASKAQKEHLERMMTSLEGEQLELPVARKGGRKAAIRARAAAARGVPGAAGGLRLTQGGNLPHPEEIDEP